MGARIVGKLQEEFGDILVADVLHDRREFLAMNRRVFLDFRCVSVEVLNAFDGRKRRFLRRKGAIPFERDDDVFVADEALACEAVARRHVIDFGIHRSPRV